MDWHKAIRSRWSVIGLGTALVCGLCYVTSHHLRRSEERSQTGTRAPARYQRIISLAPSITETLFALGLGHRVVGVTRYCDYPPEATAKRNVGGYFDPNYEAIAALKPDVVILLPEHQKPREFLEAQGIDVLTVNHGTIAGILESIHRIGEATDVPEQAGALVKTIEGRLEAVASRTRDLPHPRVLIAVGRDLEADTISDVYIAGKRGWYTELIRLAGGVNAFQGNVAFPSVSAEGILEMNPEVIVEMVGDMNGGTVDPVAAAAAWQALPQVAAVRSGRVHLLCDDFAVIPGPRFILVLEKLAAILHPEVDWDNAGSAPESNAGPGTARPQP